jgi:hypothetical protein
VLAVAGVGPGGTAINYASTVQLPPLA